MQTSAVHAQDKWRSLKSAVMGNKDTRRVALKEEWKVKIREIAEAAEHRRVGSGLPDAAEPQVGAHGMGLGGPASDQAPPQARPLTSQLIHTHSSRRVSHGLGLGHCVSAALLLKRAHTPVCTCFGGAGALTHGAAPCRKRWAAAGWSRCTRR